MNRMLGVVLATGLAFLPMSAFALDRASGIVQKFDTVTGSFVIKTESMPVREMTFSPGLDIDVEELALDVGDRLIIEYDGDLCGNEPDCVPIAEKVERAG